MDIRIFYNVKTNLCIFLLLLGIGGLSAGCGNNAEETMAESETVAEPVNEDTAQDKRTESVSENDGANEAGVRAEEEKEAGKDASEEDARPAPVKVKGFTSADRWPGLQKWMN